MLLHFYHTSFGDLRNIAYTYPALLFAWISIKVYRVIFRTYPDPSVMWLPKTPNSLGFSRSKLKLKFYFSNNFFKQSATFNFIGIALVWLLFMIIVDIFAAEQYKQSDLMHLFTYSTMKLFVSCAFLNNFTKMAYKKGSIAFLKASHIYAKVIIAFLAKLDRRDSTNFKTSGKIWDRFCKIWG